MSAMDSQLVFGAATIGTYSIYHYFEPDNLAAHFLLLLATPLAVATYTAADLGRLALIFTVCSTYWAGLLLLAAAYRLAWFHPLASYPGPRLARVSKLWMVRATVTGHPHEILRELHRKYGDVVRIGPNELSLARGDAIQPILMGKTLKKGPYYNTRVMDGVNSLDGVREWSAHAARRKPWTKAMGIAALKGYDALLVDKVNELLDALDARARTGEAVNISEWMTFFAFDFMGHMAFDHDFGMMKSGKDADGFLDIIKRGVTIHAYISHIPWTVPFLTPIPSKDVNAAREFGTRVITRRKAAEVQRKDLFYYLSGEDEEQEGSSEQTNVLLEELKADALLAIVAGSDTSATALSNLWYFLLQYPQYYARLRKEVQDAFPDGENVFNFARHAEMPYLNACINETLRLLPPVPMGLQRRVDTGTGGMLISGSFIPDGTQVSVHQYTTHRSPAHFSPQPDMFWPDRWLSQDRYTLPTGEVISKDAVTTDRAAFIPFSAGPQNCAGRALAVMELRAVVCAFVRRFAGMEVAEGFELASWERNLVDVYVTFRGDLLLKLKADS